VKLVAGILGLATRPGGRVDRALFLVVVRRPHVKRAAAFL